MTTWFQVSIDRNEDIKTAANLGIARIRRNRNGTQSPSTSATSCRSSPISRSAPTPAQRAHRRQVSHTCAARERQEKPRLRFRPGRGFCWHSELTCAGVSIARPWQIAQFKASQERPFCHIAWGPSMFQCDVPFALAAQAIFGQVNADGKGLVVPGLS